MDGFIQDLRYAGRMLLKSPGFTGVALLALTLGIGANTAMFSLLDAVLLRPLPFEAEERLVALWGHHPQIGREEASLPDFNDWRAESKLVEAMAAISERTYGLSGDEEPERVRGSAVSASLLGLLGVRPSLGRGFLPEEEKFGAEPVVLLGDALWRRRYGADPDILGRKLTVNGAPTTVIGVLPPGLPVPRTADLVVPLALDPAKLGRRDDFLLVIGRLASGASLGAAQTELKSVASRLEKQYPETNAGWSVELVPLREQLSGPVRLPLLVLGGAVGFVLLIACANVANLLLARATARVREVAIRTALGASRGRIVRQLVTESLLLAMLGGVLGTLLAVWATALLQQLVPTGVPLVAEAGVDWRVLGFTLALTVLTGLLFGLVPALGSARPDLHSGLKEGERAGVGASRSRLRSSLAAAEIALAMVLLVGGGLLLRSFASLQHVEPGFDPRGVLTLRVGLPGTVYPEGAQRRDFFQTLREKARALPGVELAAMTTNPPLMGGSYRSFEIEGRPAPAADQVQDAEIFIVSEDYFGALRIPVLSGRDFGDEDRPDGPRAALINQTMARRYWPDADPIGQRITMGDPKDPASWMTVVGVVGDVRNAGLDQELYPQMYGFARQRPQPNMTVVLRSAGDPLQHVAAARAVIRSMDPQLPVFGIATMESVVADSIARPKFTALLTGVFAGVALLLASLGVYGVLAFTVAQRIHEFGIRLALGARRRDILRLVLRHGLLIAAAGVGAGAAVAYGLSRSLTGLLYSVSPTDPLTFASVAGILSAVALLACLVPARRAMSVDPMSSLRHE